MTRTGTNRPAYRELRPWLRHLAATGRLAVGKPGVDLKFELAALAKRRDGLEAVLFPAPRDAAGKGHEVPVVAGFVAGRDWIAEAMGAEPAEVLERFQRAVESPLPWREVDRASASVQQVVNETPDLTSDLPIPTHNALDSGPYISAGVVIARNPRTGAQNVSINRIQISGPDRLGILILPRHLHHFFEAAESAGDPLEVAIAIGVDPCTLLASQAVVPLDYDELEIAGALHGEALPVVKCVTNEVRVPATAEIVIEGRLLPNERAMEGPFGEFPQYYGEAGEREVIAVDAVTHRAAPLFHTIVSAGMEHLLLGAIPREATILGLLRQSFPNVLDVHLSVGGVCRYHLHVKIRKRVEGEQRNIIAAAFAAHADLKQVIVVDEDVDIQDPAAVEWAVATRFQASRDVVILPSALGSRLDPSTEDGIGDKMGLDATMALERNEFKFTVVHVPGEDDPATDELIDVDGDPSALIAD